MNTDYTKQSSVDNEFAFDDGVGNALTEKNTYTFSWAKTGIALFIGLTLIIFITFGLLEIGKRIIDIGTPVVDFSNDIVSLDNSLTDQPSVDGWDTIPETAPLTIEPDTTVLSTPPSDVTPPVSSPQIASSPITPSPIANPSPSATQPLLYRVIAGSFTSKPNAIQALNALKKKNIDGYILDRGDVASGARYQIQVGAFQSFNSAKNAVQRFKKMRIDTYITAR
jgi:cell division septation protein DedD